MPYVKRDAQCRILSLHRVAETGGGDYLPNSHPDVLAFLGQEENGMEKMDLEFIRVIEDVIDLLVDRNIIMFTDLPGAVQQKLNMRRSARTSNGGSNPFDDDIVHLP